MGKNHCYFVSGFFQIFEEGILCVQSRSDISLILIPVRYLLCFGKTSVSSFLSLPSPSQCFDPKNNA